MAAFTQTAHTDDGRNLMAKGIAGKPIRFTRIVMGDGYIPLDTKPREMTGLTNELISLPVPKNGVQVLGGGEVMIWAPFSNAELAMGFYYREVGAYAIDPDSGEEILYCYGNAGADAEWIPATGGQTIIEKRVRIVTIIGEAENVTASLESGIILTVEDLEAHNHDPEAHPNLGATKYLTTIRHELNRFPIGVLYATRYAAGTQGAGEGPAGGEKSRQVACRLEPIDRSTVEVYGASSYGENPAVNRISGADYALVYPDSVDNLLLILR